MTGELANSKALSSSKLKVLAVLREEAAQDLEERIRIGVKIGRNLYTLSQHRGLLTQTDVEDSKSEMRIWDDYNTVMLQRIFTEESFYKHYVSCAPHIDRLLKDQYNYDYAVKIVNWCRRKVDELKSIKEQLPLYETAAKLPAAESVATESILVDNKVFLVHGHDEGVKQTVARFIEQVGLEPVILGEKTGKGRALMEKLEQESDIDYAIVLLTPDDEGKTRGEESELKHRARQNVILELGYFIGKLGRSKVCPLTLESVEIPSDYHGIEYILFDAAGGWKLKLMNELEAAGYKPDRSKLK